MRNLEELNLFYQRYRQEDAIDTLTNILESIDAELPQRESIKRFFYLNMTLSCKKCRYNFELNSFTKSGRSEMCSNCKNYLEVKIERNPDYLILINPEELIKIQSLGSDLYSLVSRVLYHGSGKAGHYTCVRSKNGK